MKYNYSPIGFGWWKTKITAPGEGLRNSSIIKSSQTVCQPLPWIARKARFILSHSFFIFFPTLFRIRKREKTAPLQFKRFSFFHTSRIRGEKKTFLNTRSRRTVFLSDGGKSTVINLSSWLNFFQQWNWQWQRSEL